MAVDASLIEADANKQLSASKEEWDVGRFDVDAAPRALRWYLDTLDEAAFGATREVQPNSPPIPTRPANASRDIAAQYTAGNRLRRVKDQRSLPILTNT